MITEQKKLNLLRKIIKEEYKKLICESFNDDNDIIFDIISHKAGKIGDDPVLDTMFKISKMPPTMNKFNLFMTTSKNLKDKNLRQAISVFYKKASDNGFYKKEFRHIADNKSSFVAEFFSLFAQAYNYYISVNHQ